MKKLALFTIVIIAISFSSCKKAERVCCSPSSYMPYIAADKNTVKWNAMPASEKLGADSLAITGSLTEERLILRIKFNGKGSYTLIGNQAKFFTTVGRDVITSDYAADETAVNTLAVVDYDERLKVFAGTYSVTLKKLYANPTADYPATIKFLNSKFSVKIPQ